MKGSFIYNATQDTSWWLILLRATHLLLSTLFVFLQGLIIQRCDLGISVAYGVNMVFAFSSVSYCFADIITSLLKSSYYCSPFINILRVTHFRYSEVFGSNDSEQRLLRTFVHINISSAISLFS
ncbi:hypothetical protein SO802_013017 [Lithocarpus litseifolius]|uniref:Uncharacterized protein n=1 Tax=Lithocarpus litseifolius TaxID=425828 RepID=A0AAW2D552_9ROSI